MYFTRRLLRFSYKELNARGTEWLKSNRGRIFRIGLLGATVVIYPVTAMLRDAPLLKYTFPSRFNAVELPPDLAQIAHEEYMRFLEKEQRKENDTYAREFIQGKLDSYECVSAGSLGVRSGAYIALPYFARFRTVEEARDYFKKNHPKSIRFLGEDVDIDWDSPQGNELLETFVLSENVLRFLFLRDLYTHDTYFTLASQPLSWATFSSFASFFMYFLHMSRIGGTTAMSFIVLYAVCMYGAYRGCKEWTFLHKYFTGIHGDVMAAKTSFEHTEGGKEYYWKMLKRNRILRDLHPYLYTQIKMSGDLRYTAIPIMTRYDHLKETKEEDDEIKGIMEGDDF